MPQRLGVPQPQSRPQRRADQRQGRLAACRQSALRAGIPKPIHPHTLRHSFATHLFDNGAELPVVQRLLGHEDPRDTMVYIHLSNRTLRAAPNPLETIRLSGARETTPS